MAGFRETRNVELSTIYYLEQSIALDWTGITVVKSFTNAYKSALPIVCIRLTSPAPKRLEIGSTTLDFDYTISIDIFATDDGQRLDLADYIVNKLKDRWVYYVHTRGTGETLNKVASGGIMVKQFVSNLPIEFNENVDKYDQHRHFIQIVVRKSDNNA
jgi:hypothetical protein